MDATRSVPIGQTPPQSLRGLADLLPLCFPCSVSLMKAVRRGVYFLVRDMEVVYVGQTVAGLSRVFGHHKDKLFDSAWFLPVRGNDETREALERQWINKLLPVYNKDAVTQRVRQRLEERTAIEKQGKADWDRLERIFDGEDPDTADVLVWFAKLAAGDGNGGPGPC